MRIFSRGGQFDAKGGVLHTPKKNVIITVPPNTFARKAVLALGIESGRPPFLSTAGRVESPEHYKLSLPAGAMAEGSSISVQLPYPGKEFDPLLTTLMVRNDHGVQLALPAKKSGENHSITGTLNASLARALARHTTPSRALQLTFFTVNRGEARKEDSTLVTGAFQFTNNAWTPLPSGTTFPGQRIALLFHGIESCLDDLVTLAEFIQSFQASGQSTPLYSAVIGFQYSSNAPLAQIGTAAANLMQPFLVGTAGVDVFSHSMGNVVCRYAMETTSLSSRIGSYVQNYFSLGGPHAGVPFADLAWLQTLLNLFDVACVPCLLDLVTYGQNGTPYTNFLTNLNPTTQGPNYSTANYFTMSGDDWEAYGVPGWTLRFPYDIECGWGSPEDGLVGNYSAQSSVLEYQSGSWQPNSPLDLDHTELHTSPLAFAVIANWLNAVYSSSRLRRPLQHSGQYK